MNLTALIINRFFQIVILIVIIDVFLSYFMSPYQPVRQFFDRIVNPMLNPLRRIIPPIGGVDLSPLVLIIVLQVLGFVLGSLLG